MSYIEFRDTHYLKSLSCFLSFYLYYPSNISLLFAFSSHSIVSYLPVQLLSLTFTLQRPVNLSLLQWILQQKRIDPIPSTPPPSLPEWVYRALFLLSRETHFLKASTKGTWVRDRLEGNDASTQKHALLNPQTREDTLINTIQVYWESGKSKREIDSLLTFLFGVSNTREKCFDSTKHLWKRKE